MNIKLKVSLVATAYMQYKRGREGGEKTYSLEPKNSLLFLNEMEQE